MFIANLPKATKFCLLCGKYMWRRRVFIRMGGRKVEKVFVEPEQIEVPSLKELARAMLLGAQLLLSG